MCNFLALNLTVSFLGGAINNNGTGMYKDEKQRKIAERKRAKRAKDRSCGQIKWKDLQIILLKDEGNLQKFKEKFCAGCKQNADGDCRKFGRKIDDLTKFPTEIEKWR